MELEDNISAYIKEKGITIAAMSRATGIPYSNLYGSFFHNKKNRQIRGSELIAVSKFLGIDPREFGETKKGLPL
ncbi:helix-turn-helix transcriptional regulator [Enterocloster clostridioformis]|uniref:helix-turn-helix domain-containing protein n=1 Tax=Enterocloster clostridioformis TaxID=1531 RepID=UPI001F2E20CD|nr:helix-turn-helix transcriptional regulator [Enterocloster clostridioformis]MCF2705097.1 helix-turn-helix transcriptional regulator [Enterocloster clostridioformis]